MEFFEVIWLFDRAINPQKWKMQICIDFDEGWFLRINTRGVIRPCVPIAKAANEFLDHDSHIDCSINMIDEFEVEDAMAREGVIGRVDLDCASEVLDALCKAPFISERDKDRLRVLFASHI